MSPPSAAPAGGCSLVMPRDAARCLRVRKLEAGGDGVALDSREAVGPSKPILDDFANDQCLIA